MCGVMSHPAVDAYQLADRTRINQKNKSIFILSLAYETAGEDCCG